MLQIIVAASIMWLSPDLNRRVAARYAQMIVREAEKNDIDPFLVVAQIQLESRFNRRAKSQTNDFGLMQLHVSKTTHSRYLGREHMLFNARRNIRIGVKMLKYWKQYHKKFCKYRRPHEWFEHYMWGNRIRGSKQGNKQRKLYNELKERYYYMIGTI